MITKIRLCFTLITKYLTGFLNTHTPKISKKQKNPIKDRSELKTEIMVHIDHGIGRFVGLEKMETGGSEHEVLGVGLKTMMLFLLTSTLSQNSKILRVGETPC